MEKGFRLSPALKSRDLHVSLQAAHQTEAEPAQLQRAGGRDLGRGESHEQGPWPWYACASAAQLSNNRGLGHGCPSLGFDQQGPTALVDD